MTNSTAKLTLTCLLLFCQLFVNAQKQQPNIVVLYADDISARELPIYGSTVWSMPKGGELKGGDTQDAMYRAQTPVLDSLANAGCYIKTAWAATICGPSRAMMMTGRYAHRHKWWHNNDKGKAPDGTSLWRLYDSSPHTIGHVAQKGGYATYWAGKTQMSDVREFGFDEGCFTPGEGSYNTAIHTTNFRLETRIEDGEKKIYNADTNKEVESYAQSGWYWKPHVQLMNHPSNTDELEWWPNNDQAKDTFGLNTYGPDVEREDIFDFMERKQKETTPFFISHPSRLGHDAWDFLHPNSGNKWPGTPKISWDGVKYTRTNPNVTGSVGVYDIHGTVTDDGIHHQINYLDYQVSLYLQKFRELGIETNTIFIFCADNGTSGYGKSDPTSQKGTHVPMIIYAPGLEMTKQGKQDILVNISDILPTVAEIAGVTIPDTYEVNGQSLLPFLTTEQTTHRPWIYGYHKGLQIIRGHSVLRDGKGNWYDVAADPADLISFYKIEDWGQVSELHRQEREALEGVLPAFDLYETEHDTTENVAGTVAPLRRVLKSGN
jgi:arylsulfatase A-like enzyme